MEGHAKYQDSTKNHLANRIFPLTCFQKTPVKLCTYIHIYVYTDMYTKAHVYTYTLTYTFLHIHEYTLHILV